VKYDLNRVREECLKLMGWRVTNHYQPPRWWNRDDPPEANTRTIDDLPDPTRSLDDALPLLHIYGIELHPEEHDPVTYRAVSRSPKDVMLRGFEPDVENENPALAVCLCALLNAGRDLKEFEVSP